MQNIKLLPVRLVGSINMKKIVEKLIKLNKTIATMESCTGGYIVNAITNIEGSSNILKYSAITYSNEFKIKMGVSKKTIDTYSVYSLEVAKEMSKQIAIFANSNYGIGITGKLNNVDNHNLTGPDNRIFISLYNKDNDIYQTLTIDVPKKNREKNKEIIKNILKEALVLFIN